MRALSCLLGLCVADQLLQHESLLVQLFELLFDAIEQLLIRQMHATAAMQRTGGCAGTAAAMATVRASVMMEHRRKLVALVDGSLLQRSSGHVQAAASVLPIDTHKRFEPQTS